MEFEHRGQSWCCRNFLTALITLLSPFEWRLGFAMIRNQIKDKYWSSGKLLAYLFAVFVVAPYVLPFVLPPCVHVVWYMGHILARFAWTCADRMLHYLTSFWVIRATWVLMQYTVLPMHTYLTPLFVRLVFVPFCLPRLMVYAVSRLRRTAHRLIVDFALIIEHRVFFLMWDHRVEKKAMTDEFKMEKDNLKMQLTRLRDRINGLGESHENEMKALIAEHTRQTNARLDQITSLQTQLQTARSLNTEHAAERQRLTQEHAQCIARLKAQINDLNDHSRVLRQQSDADSHAHARQMRDTGAKVQAFADTLEAVEALQRKLTSQMRPSEIGPAIAILEAKLDSRENEVNRMARQMEKKDQALCEMKKMLEATHAQLMTKEAQLGTKEAELKKQAEEFLAEKNKQAEAATKQEDKPSVPLSNCDKQIIFKLAKSSEFHCVLSSRQGIDGFLEHVVKPHMKLDANQQYLSQWMLSILSESIVEHYITVTFGEGYHLVKSMIKLLLELPEPVPINKKNIHLVFLKLHPDKYPNGTPVWLRGMREKMFKVFKAESVQFLA